MDTSLFPDYRPSKEYLVCIDSDGCVFDTMEIKHKECFCPAVVQAFSLQPVSRYVREIWDFLNLYSRDRGRNRFIEVVKMFGLLAERKEIREYGLTLPDITPLKEWLERTAVQNNEMLAKEEAPILRTTYAWSLDVNRRIADMVHGIPPFPYAGRSVEALSGKADIVIVSATPREALEREWAEHGLRDRIRLLCAQEDGSKAECIASIRGHYAAHHVLMIGDAPGDAEAADKNGVLFYPVRPGEENASWKEFLEEDMELFLTDSYAGAAEEKQRQRFYACLPELPPWQT